MNRFAAVVRKEFLLILPRPALWIQLIVLPAVLVVLISFAFQNLLGSPDRLPLLVLDLDDSSESEFLVSTLGGTGYLDVDREVSASSDVTESEAITKFDRGRRPAVLVVPDGYGDALIEGNKTSLLLYTDPGQPSPSFLIQTALQAVADQLSFTEAGVRIAIAQSSRDPSLVRTDVMNGVASFIASPPLQPELSLSKEGRGLPSPFEQTVPAFTMWFSATISSYLYFIMLQERREWGTGSRIATIAMPWWPHVLGKGVVAYAFGVFQFIFMMGAARLLFGMELGSVLNLACVVGVFLLVPICIGIAVASFTRTVAAGDSAFSLWANIAPIVGGLLVPVFLLPALLGAFARVSPYYWSLRATQEVTIRGASIADVWLELAVLVAFAAAILAVSLPRFNYRRVDD
jgi:ABC-2 type transport system permease protein